MGANTQGLATLQMLNILELVRSERDGVPVDVLLSTSRRKQSGSTYEDRARYYADPHFAKIPVGVAELERLCERARKANQDGSNPGAGVTQGRHRAMAILRISLWLIRTA